MRNLAKFSLFLMFLFTLTVGHTVSATENAKAETEVTVKKDVTVYYFHNARRCMTCKTLESEAKNAVESLYGGEVKFVAYNLEDATGKKKAVELGVNGQSLLIVGSDKKINITNEGFLNARTNPDKFRQIIKDKIDPLLG